MAENVTLDFPSWRDHPAGRAPMMGIGIPSVGISRDSTNSGGISLDWPTLSTRSRGPACGLDAAGHRRGPPHRCRCTGSRRPPPATPVRDSPLRLTRRGLRSARTHRPPGVPILRG